jgi:hypothetical protein
MVVASRTLAGQSRTDSTVKFDPAAQSLGLFGVYYGWYNVAIALVVCTLSVGSTFYSFGLYVKPAAA